tara:strand:- start:328 stop:459 length:132 start_codon:yes stop_codon:yes gene_type:complete
MREDYIREKVIYKEEVWSLSRNRRWREAYWRSVAVFFEDLSFL